MPYYDYMCQSCGTEFEVQRSMKDTSRVKCEACNSPRTTKVFAATGIHFKGSGFYVTDSKENGSNSAGKGSGKAQATDDSKLDKSKKPETKAKSTVDTKTDSKKSDSAVKKRQPAGKK